jgi:DNA polymerase III delta prime subunit
MPHHEKPVPILVLSGPPAVGKTTVSWEIFDQLVDDGHQPALVDLDLLGACWPVPDDDPYNERLKALNLTSVWQNFQRAGAGCLIAAGVIENRESLAMYGAAIPGAVMALCRLTAGGDELRSRIVCRGRERGDGIDKLHRRAIRLSHELEQNDCADFCIDTEDRSIPDVAELVRARAGGWPRQVSGKTS